MHKRKEYFHNNHAYAAGFPKRDKLYVIILSISPVYSVIYRTMTRLFLAITEKNRTNIKYMLRTISYFHQAYSYYELS